MGKVPTGWGFRGDGVGGKRQDLASVSRVQGRPIFTMYGIVSRNSHDS
jgi:hypothetical protein